MIGDIAAAIGRMELDSGAAQHVSAASEERFIASTEEFASESSKATVLAANILQALLVACVVLWVLDVPRQVFGVSFYTTFHEPPAPKSVRGLSSAQSGPPPRWRRRERVYWMLTIMCVVIPAFLIAWVSYDDGIADYLGRMYPGRVALMRLREPKPLILRAGA